jgi:hypothetical protein
MRADPRFSPAGAAKSCDAQGNGSAATFTACLASQTAANSASTWNACPTSAEYAAALLGNSQADVTARPAAFAYPSSAADVAAVVTCANKANLTWVVRGGGHSYLAKSLVEGGVVIDMGNLIDMKVVADTLVVGAGQRLGPIYALLADKGLYLPAGTCGGVGISGLILGGGVGHATRAAGVTSDTVVSAKVCGVEAHAPASRRCSPPSSGARAAAPAALERLGAAGTRPRPRRPTRPAAPAAAPPPPSHGGSHLRTHTNPRLQVMLSNGTVVDASTIDNPDLLWAIRGGGPFYGIVLEWTLKISAAPTTVRRRGWPAAGRQCARCAALLATSCPWRAALRGWPPAPCRPPAGPQPALEARRGEAEAPDLGRRAAALQVTTLDYAWPSATAATAAQVRHPAQMRAPHSPSSPGGLRGLLCPQQRLLMGPPEAGTRGGAISWSPATGMHLGFVWVRGWGVGDGGGGARHHHARLSAPSRTP